MERHADADPTDYQAEVPSAGSVRRTTWPDVVTFLASEAAGFVTGQRITVNGGHTVT